MMLTAACSASHGGDGSENAAGEQLERAGIAAGLVADPAAAPLDGIWSRDTDRMCILPRLGDSDGSTRRIGVVLDYGEGQGCVARGTLKRRGAQLNVAFGDCRFAARFDGESIQFPAALPNACERLCTGRATMSALIVERISTSTAEARTLRSGDGGAMCDDRAG
ncbi:hypothetical protein [Sphingomonas sp. Leaf21]|uniref:hypothetical protein n=1 Tax=Sphingomonas sp. Leaf21 TaxID=2876550 RepID=UPI001E65CA02|nr:hypothetical protein [Sphingomonas sp. Leaf21]